MSHNKITLATYQNHFDRYIETTSHEATGTRTEFIESLLAKISYDTPILEIGSAFGRDAKSIQNAGYTNLTVTDAFDAAIDELHRRGFDAKKLDILTDEPEGEYGLIIALAVFLHFTAEELDETLRKLVPHLGKYGVLGFTVKRGDGEEWSDNKMGAPRYFRYWQADELQELVGSCGYEIIQAGPIGDSKKWLGVTCFPAQDYNSTNDVISTVRSSGNLK